MTYNFRPLEINTHATRERLSERKAAVAVVNAPGVPAAKRDVRLYRYWADSNEWIRAAINHRKTQVSSSPWDIVPLDDAQPYSIEDQARVLDLFTHPNPKTDSFRTLVEACVEDLLVLDAGCIEIVRTRRGIPAQLWGIDSQWIRVSTKWQGEPDEPRYFWYPQGRFAGALLDNDLIYMMQNPSTHRVLGMSPVEILRETIDAEIAASRFNKGQVLQVPPQGIIDLGEDASTANVDQFERYWRAEIAGQKPTAIIGGTKNSKFIPFGRSQRDMQFLQWQTYLIRKITSVFGISPQDLGVTFDVNRANSETQADMSEDRGLRPLITLIEAHFNREVVGDFARSRAKAMYWHGDMDIKDLRMAVALSYMDHRMASTKRLIKATPLANPVNLHFRFKIPSGRNAMARAQQHKLELAGIAWDTINRVRDEELLDPVEGGDEIIVPTPLGPVRLSSIIGSQLASPNEQAIIDKLLENAPMILASQIAGKAAGESSLLSTSTATGE